MESSCAQAASGAVLQPEDSSGVVQDVKMAKAMKSKMKREKKKLARLQDGLSKMHEDATEIDGITDEKIDGFNDEKIDGINDEKIDDISPTGPTMHG